ncbi:hypothetical protein [Pyrococcus kukulkanii]|uniref:Uncharacterized protein n=1 Tax=Pyrococcus kukulkanii TaxID=1609559 RepID=A0ABV4T7R7_9EURY
MPVVFEKNLHKLKDEFSYATQVVAPDDVMERVIERLDFLYNVFMPPMKIVKDEGQPSVYHVYTNEGKEEWVVGFIMKVMDDLGIGYTKHEDEWGRVVSINVTHS